jgi:AcrR family transcriptional regulator
VNATTSNRSTGQFLDRDTLVATAADLADKIGWTELTLSKVAEAVDRHVSSLYSHVDGLDALRREIAVLAET